MIEEIKSVIEADPTLPQYIDGNLTFRFQPDYKILLKYRFICNDENEMEAESFSKSAGSLFLHYNPFIHLINASPGLAPGEPDRWKTGPSGTLSHRNGKSRAWKQEECRCG
mgnify:CR=1 FL=1